MFFSSTLSSFRSNAQVEGYVPHIFWPLLRCYFSIMVFLACENIRFSSLFETSPAAKSEEKRMFSQAMVFRTLL